MVFSATTPAMERLIRRCLAKDPDERWQTAIDLKNELRWIKDAASVAPAAAQPVRNYWKKPALVLLFIVAVTSTFVAGYLYRREPAANVVRYRFALPEKAVLASPVNQTVGRTVTPAVSPDGRNFAFTARDETGRIRLWVQAIDSLSAKVVPGTDDAEAPFWSPDSRS